MARPRSDVQAAKGKTGGGLSFHKASSRYYSIDKDGQRKYWGRDKETAIERYRACLKLWPLWKMTDEEAVQELCWAGLDEDDVNPKLIQMAKRNRFFFTTIGSMAIPTNPWQSSPTPAECRGGQHLSRNLRLTLTASGC